MSGRETSRIVIINKSEICNCILQRAFHMLKDKIRELIGVFDATNFFTFLL